MKKTIAKILKLILFLFVAAITTIIVVVLSPQPLFANKLEYKNFRVYSNDKTDPAITVVLDNAMALVKRSQLYDPDYRYNIILCYNSFYNKVDDKLLGEGPTARTTLHNIVVKVRIDAANNLAFPTFHKACAVNLAELIAHEMMHCLQANRYGIWKFNPFRHPEMWKLEGYPEYVARQALLSAKGYSLRADIERYVELKKNGTDIWIPAEEGRCDVPDYYCRGRLMMQYLIDIRKLSYDQILTDTTAEQHVYEEMLDWARKN